MPTLIVGLGNPGKKYAPTRHNAGFLAVEAFRRLHEDVFSAWSDSKDFLGKVAQGKINGKKTILLLPQTFMNNSGDAVAAAARFFKIDAKDVIIVCDELDLPLGRIRVRSGGSSSHKGVRSIIAWAMTDQIRRVRIGIATERLKTVPAEDYVLERFAPSEKKEFDGACQRAADALSSILSEGIDAAMNKYN